MNKNLKRIIAATLVIGAFSTMQPLRYTNGFMTIKAYADSSDDYLLKKLNVYEAKSGHELDLLGSDWKKANFDKRSKENYCVKVDSDVNSIRIGASTDAEAYAIYKENSNKDYKGKDISLSSGTTKIYIKTYDSKSDASDDKNAKREYRITVKKGSGDYDSSSSMSSIKYDSIYLNDLKLSDGKINFSKFTEFYDINVKHDVEEIEITATPEDNDYTVEIDGEKVNKDDDYKTKVGLKEGKNIIKIKIEDEEDEYKRIYTLNVTRASNASNSNNLNSDSSINDINNNGTSFNQSTNNKYNQWVIVNGKWQYNDLMGNPFKNEWHYDSNSGKWYFLDSNGDMVTKWLNKNGTWYYFDENGVMATGWKLIQGKWYYFNFLGVMKTGKILDDGNWYYLNSSGELM